MTEVRPFNVLFLCTGNSARSIMAEAILNRVGASKFKGYSAGSMPKGEVHPLTINLLNKLNYDTTTLRSKSWEEFSVPGAPKLDFVFTVCDNAANEVCPIWPGQPMTAHWGVPDPVAAKGNETQRALAFADTYRMLNNRISIFASLPLESLDSLTLQRHLDRPDNARRDARESLTVAPYSAPQRIATEFIGTALLLATIIGSGIMAAKLSAGNDAIALLGNTLPTGAILVVLISIFDPVSGAHFNPVVSGAFCLRGDIAPSLAFAYVAAQFCGGLTGVIVAHAMFDLPLMEFATKVRTGPGQWLAEGVATFGLLLTIIGTLRAKPDAVALNVGLYITAAYWFTASTSFANPAVTIARAFSDTFAGIRLPDVTPFIIAQLAGAAVAVFIAGWLFHPALRSRPETISAE
jgi:glycerol uptake facilitator-like aquaporin/protein-tyrosine-phosphatase